MHVATAKVAELDPQASSAIFSLLQQSRTEEGFNLSDSELAQIRAYLNTLPKTLSGRPELKLDGLGRVQIQANFNGLTLNFYPASPRVRELRTADYGELQHQHFTVDELKSAGNNFGVVNRVLPEQPFAQINLNSDNQNFTLTSFSSSGLSSHYYSLTA